jgi:acyl-coenzyme A thioesterase PaaI-like protein
MSEYDGDTSRDAGSRGAITAVQEFLGGPECDEDGWLFDFGEHLESPWGGVYGGALAASVLTAARCAIPDRAPCSLHIQFVRSVLRGTSRATADIRHLGRAVATVQVDLHDSRGKLAATALVTMVTPDSVAVEFHDTSAVVFELGGVPLTDAEMAFTERAPIVQALGMDRGERRYIENVCPSITGEPASAVELVVPWEDLDHTGPEVACLAADPANGAPISAAFGDRSILFPNTDLSLRFTTAPAQREVIAAGTLLSVQRGTTTVAIEVQAGDQQLARGLSSSLLIANP